MAKAKLFWAKGVKEAKRLQSGKIVANPFAVEVKRNFKQEWKWNEGEIVMWWDGGILMVGFKCSGCGEIQDISSTGLRR